MPISKQELLKRDFRKTVDRERHELRERINFKAPDRPVYDPFTPLRLQEILRRLNSFTDFLLHDCASCSAMIPVISRMSSERCFADLPAQWHPQMSRHRIVI